MCSDGMSGRSYSNRSPMRIPSHVAHIAQLAAAKGGLTTYEELLSKNNSATAPVPKKPTGNGCCAQMSGHCLYINTE